MRATKVIGRGWAENTGAEVEERHTCSGVGVGERGVWSGTRVMGTESTASTPARGVEGGKKPGSSWQQSECDNQKRSQDALVWAECWKAHAGAISQDPLKAPAVTMKLASVTIATIMACNRS